MVVAAAVTELSVSKRFRHAIIYLSLVNVMVLGISFSQLLARSKRNNRLSIHEHDLRNHYYLVNFNARQATLLAQRFAKKQQVPVYLWDDFGGTGIHFYLAAYKVPFRMYDTGVDFRSPAILIANNKKDVEAELMKKHIPYRKLLRDEYQYNLFRVEEKKY